MSKRLEFPRKTKAAIINRAAGKCEKCEAALKPSEGEVDHILSCALGGEPTMANGRLICRVCHREKTASDIRAIRKSDRQRDKSTGAVRPKRSIKSPPSVKNGDRPAKQSPPYRSLYEVKP
jgi:5-methylcytosine-specific restriction protein A